jgi:hypothetical protein
MVFARMWKNVSHSPDLFPDIPGTMAEKDPPRATRSTTVIRRTGCAAPRGCPVT